MPNFNTTDLLYAALKSCVYVMERDLNGLSVIQPELKQAKQAIDQFELVDAEFEEWNGEGLPPVGLEIECTYDSWGYWLKGKVLCYGEKTIFMEQESSKGNGKFEGSMNPDGIRFRPIRTPEQIAAEKYEADAADLAEVMTGHRDRSKDCFLHIAKVVLDAGYRKQVTE